MCKSWMVMVSVMLAVQAAVVVNPVTGISDQNLVFSGSIPISATNNLFFTYYGVDNQKDQSQLKNFPLLVVVGRYSISYLAQEALLSI